jgi:hypothetical protein
MLSGGFKWQPLSHADNPVGRQPGQARPALNLESR